MSDTPRVDEYIRAYNEKEKWARDMSPVELAEQLERENAALRDTLEEIYCFVNIGHAQLSPWKQDLTTWSRKVEKITGWELVSTIRRRMEGDAK